MNFEDFYHKLKNESHELFEKNEMGGESYNLVFSVWMAHQSIETNRRLIWATWFLAIATIILSGLTLYFQ